MKKITTSAQKSLQIDKRTAIKQLLASVSTDKNVVFIKTGNPSIYKAKLKDQSELIIAGFEKENGKTLAMIDHKNIPEDQRQVQQKYWRNLLDKLFA